jgi:hypothetical protein
MSQLTATIDQETLNAALGKISAAGSRQEQGKILLLPYSVTVQYQVDGLSAKIEEGNLAADANVHIEVKGFKYTERVRVTTELAFEGKQLVVRFTSLKLPVVLQLPKIGRLSLGTIDVCSILKTPMVAKFSVFQEQYPIALPNGQSILLELGTPVLTLTPGTLQIVSTINCAAEP